MSKAQSSKLKAESRKGATAPTSRKSHVAGRSSTRKRGATAAENAEARAQARPPVSAQNAAELIAALEGYQAEARALRAAEQTSLRNQGQVHSVWACGRAIVHTLAVLTLARRMTVKAAVAEIATANLPGAQKLAKMPVRNVERWVNAAAKRYQKLADEDAGKRVELDELVAARGDALAQATIFNNLLAECMAPTMTGENWEGMDHNAQGVLLRAGELFVTLAKVEAEVRFKQASAARVMQEVERALRDSGGPGRRTLTREEAIAKTRAVVHEVLGMRPAGAGAAAAQEGGAS